MSSAVLAHAGGLDEIAFVALPIVIFVTLQWLSRRKRRNAVIEQENPGRGTNDSGAQ